MKKKCWKKIGKNYFNKSKEVKIYFNDYTGMYHASTPEVNKGFERKKQAIRFANKYMKKHNKC